MKKILIIADGDVAKVFVDRVIETFSSENMYYIVELKAKKYKEFSAARFKFFEFDPTSFYKLSNLLKMDFVQVIVALDSLADTEHTVKNIRTIKPQLRITVLNKGGYESDDANINTLNADEIVASRLLNSLPNVPVIAQNVGVGKGEIMEVLVPFGSSFVYKHVGVIEQKEWRIVAIYRQKKLIMPNRRRMIQPNDVLLLVGEPEVLKSVYRSIKQEHGQFPEPFGSVMYLYVDMDLLNFATADKLIRRAIFIARHFRKTLIVRVVNPSNIEILWQLKSYRDGDVIIEIEYDKDGLDEKFLSDIKAFHVGLIIISKETFASYRIKSLCLDAQIPVFKVSSKGLSDIKDASIIIGDNRDLEKISSTVFDITEQLALNIELYNYINEPQEQKEQVIEHFYNLSSIFSKNIKVIKESQNPITALKSKENFIQILPFSRKLVDGGLLSFLSTDSERHYSKLNEFHQIFIPIEM